MDANPAITADDLARIEAKLDRLNEKIDYIVERQRWQADLFDEFGPIAREAVNVAAEKLHRMERDGYFAFAREAVRVAETVVRSYSDEDVRQLGNHIVGIMDTIKNITQPAILAVANEATEVLLNQDEVEPVGLVGMVKASRDDDVQKGMAILLEVLRQVGRTASEFAESGGGGTATRARVAANGAAPKPAPATGAPAAAPAAPASAAPAAPTSAPAAETAGGQEGEGWQLTDDGHLANPEEWSEEFAVAMALALGVDLGPRHWEIVRFARNEWLQTKAAPNIRRITTGAGIETRELYQLFPKAPARTVAKIAGIPKPAGCI